MMPADTPAPVTVPEGDDPWPVLRAMQKFMPGTSRGECEIVDPHTAATMPFTIGFTILIGHPEQVMQPVFDCRTRVVEVVELAAWLKARGYEASACQWERPSGFAMPSAARWQLITGKAELPPLPAMALTMDERQAATAQAARWQIEYQKALASRPARSFRR